VRFFFEETRLFIFAVVGMLWRAIESAEQDQALE
jgi:hypothetical protein